MINFPIEESQMVRIKVDGEIIIEGPCVNKAPRLVAGELFVDYTIASLKTILYKTYIHETYATDTDYSDIVEDCAHVEAGIVPGNIDTTSKISEIMNTDYQSKGQVLDVLAEADGVDWWINYDDYTMDFGDNEASVADAPYTLDRDFGTFSDYRDVNITSDFDSLATSVIIIGREYDGAVLQCFGADTDDYDGILPLAGYDATRTQVINDSNIYFKPTRKIMDDEGAFTTTPSRVVDKYSSDTPTIEVDDVIYNKTRDQLAVVQSIDQNTSTMSIFYILPEIPGQAAGDIFFYNNEFSKAARDRVKAYGGNPKQTIKFSTFTPGFKPGQKLYFNDPLMGVCKTCAITSLGIKDMGAGITQYEISAESKTPEYFNIMKKSYMKFFRRF